MSTQETAKKNVKCGTEELRLQLFCKSLLETVVIRIVAELENNTRKENCYREPWQEELEALPTMHPREGEVIGANVSPTLGARPTWSNFSRCWHPE